MLTYVKYAPLLISATSFKIAIAMQFFLFGNALLASGSISGCSFTFELGYMKK
mgnify:CR=1 FL=1